ncbi:MAG: hypothetical protein JWM53_6016, partial [bacterium]|nr:hypothetical protein [bacterium]
MRDGRAGEQRRHPAHEQRRAVGERSGREQIRQRRAGHADVAADGDLRKELRERRAHLRVGGDDARLRLPHVGPPLE